MEAHTSDPWHRLGNLNNSVVIGLVQGHEGRGQTTAERAASRFPDAHIIVFGHCHEPMNEWHDGRLLFNCGSATDPRRAPARSVGILEVGDGVKGEIVWLHGSKDQ